MKTCKFCGGQMEEGSKFCRHCGKPAETAQPSTPPRSENKRVNYYANGTRPGEHGYYGNPPQWNGGWGRPETPGAAAFAAASLTVSIIGALLGYVAAKVDVEAAQNPGSGYGALLIFLLFIPMIVGSMLGVVGIVRSGHPGPVRNRAIGGLAVGCSAILFWLFVILVSKV